MLKREHKIALKKIIALFSVVRGYNITIIVIAQYLSSIFILAPNIKASSILCDVIFFILVLASSLSIASGYIINNFYDSKKDLINKPVKTHIDHLIKQSTKLNVYFTLNFIVVLLTLFISFRAVIYFSIYIFLLWFYSHKIKKYTLLGNIMASILTILPFFAILLYYKNFYHVIFAHASFLFLLIWIKEMVKDLVNLKGDLVSNYKTIPVVFGEEISKRIITFLSILTIIPIYTLIEYYDVGYMDIYFYFGLIILIFFLIQLWKSNTKNQFIWLYNTIKFLIILGVFCIILIDPHVILNRLF